MTRLMALDIGDVRIGVALSDSTRLLASPYTTLHVSRDETQTWNALQRLIEESEATGLVIGLPISLDGQIHAQGERIQAFAARLQQHINIPITFWDERLSTVEAERLLMQRSGGQGFGKQREQRRRQGNTGGQRHSQKRRRRNEQEIDALAATVILQEYLDNQRRTTGEHT
jgi:putative Holliday junction resolvase